jgi:hypothetical protein
MQQCDAFQHWLGERSAVEAQMDELLAAGVPVSPEERQARQVQFLALLERRDVAAHDLLEALRRRRASTKA